MMNFVSHGTQDYYPTFVRDYHGFTPAQASYITMVSNVGAIIGGVVMGYISDRIGRRRAMVTSLLLAIVAIPLWAYAPTTALLVVGAFLIQFMVQGAWGVVPAHITELSPDACRGFLPGFAYQCGVAAAGSIVYIEAVLSRAILVRDHDGPDGADGLLAGGLRHLDGPGEARGPSSAFFPRARRGSCARAPS